MAYFVITMLVMCHTISRMFEGVKPFDWLMLGIEAAVLLLILYEVVVGIVHQRQSRKRKSFLSSQVSKLSEFMDAGQKLKDVVPEHHPMGGIGIEGEKWIGLVSVWSKSVDATLLLRSTMASNAFLLVVDSSNHDRLVYKPNGFSFFLTGNVREHYQAPTFSNE